MAVLVARLHGNETIRIDLTDGHEYIAGRASDCDFQIEESTGVSRYHFKIYQEDGIWTVELLSRYGEVIFEGKSATKFHLKDESKFHVPPYEFYYTEEVESIEPETGSSQTQTNNKEKSFPQSGSSEDFSYQQEEKSLIAIQASSNQDYPLPEDVDFEEDTLDGVSQLEASLSISTPESDKTRQVKLDGTHWLAGRDDICTLKLRHKKVSRKHFEITNTGQQFFLIDLGSANGTKVNGARLLANKPHELTSGDLIEIGELQITFELRDGNFNQKLQALSIITEQEQQNWVQQTPEQQYMGFPAEGGGAVQIRPPQVAKTSLVGKLTENKIRLVLIVTIPLLIYGLFSGGPEKGKTESATKSQTKPLLNKEEQAIVRNTYGLAKGYLTQGKYELCISELNKLHGITKVYQDSKQIENLCNKALTDLRILDERYKEKQAQEENEKTINSTIANCRSQMNKSTTAEKLEQCLQPALELSPDHPDISSLFEELRLNKMAKDQAKARVMAKTRRVKAGEAKYNAAKRLLERGKLRMAIKAYEKFLKANYPDPKKLRPAAKRTIASTQETIDKKVRSLLTEGQQFFTSRKLKDAIKKADLALKGDPTSSEALSLRNKATASLRKDMKRIYENSVLEENLGNVDAAKELWRQILDGDQKRGEYYKKAARKLKKYGEVVSP